MDAEYYQIKILEQIICFGHNVVVRNQKIIDVFSRISSFGTSFWIVGMNLLFQHQWKQTWTK
jgi:hypothetical protein